MRRAGTMFAFVVTLLSCGAFVGRAQAATFTVGNNSDTVGACANPATDNCSLRQLITYENNLASTPSPSDTIVVPANSYFLTNGALPITHSLSIAGAGARTTTVDQGSQTLDRVFDIRLPRVGSAPAVAISGLTIEFGTADGNNGLVGGDVRNQGILTLSEDQITGGTASSGSGGGIANVGGTLTLTHSLVAGNNSTSANGGGEAGGIENYGDTTVGAGKLTIDNSTISGNTAALGGGIFSLCNGPGGACSASGATNTTSITNSTIAFNDGGARTDQPNAGGLLASQGTIAVQNSIVASNTVDTPNPSTASNCHSTGISSLGHNLESGADCAFKAAGDLQNTDPKFTSTSLEDNGGNTNTLAVDAKSPAVDAVPSGAPGCGGTDQRDIGRPQGTGCDIGAVELFQPTEGKSAQIQVNADSCGQIGPATINWGDGSPSSSSNSFIGTHTYAEEGIRTGSVTYSNDCNPSGKTVPFDVKIIDAALAATPSALTATTGVPINGGQVASFTDADPNGAAADYSATINWGDGKSSPGSVSTAPGGFAANGTHTYTSPGSFQTTVSIADIGGAASSVHGTATVRSTPSAITSKPVVRSSTAAGLSGLVNPEGLFTTAHFVYGLDKSYRPAGFSGNIYDQSTSNQPEGSDFSDHLLAAGVSGLIPNALYHVRLVASNLAGTTNGPDQTFKTKKDPSPHLPVLGKNENFVPVSGLVFVVIRGKLVPLTEARQFPLGTVIDALRGSLTLVGGTGTKGKTYTGVFGGAVFRVTQTRFGADKGQTILTLIEGTFGVPSYRSCKAKHAGDGSPTAHATLSSRILQTLRSRSRGRFRTRGRYAAGTVRGTQWTTSDRCNGTLIAVQVHLVLVTDLVKHITVVVHAGHSYLAKAP